MFAGVLSHLLMDALTVQGPALLAPFSAERFQLDWFYFVDLLPLAISSPLFVLTLWKLGTPKLRTRLIAVLLVAVLATGAWRGITKCAVESANPGLFIGGHIRDGISVPNCLAAGEKLAARAQSLLSRLEGHYSSPSKMIPQRQEMG